MGGSAPGAGKHAITSRSLRGSRSRVGERVDDALILVNTATDAILELNETAARIWDLLTASVPPAELVAILAREYRASEAQLETDIDELVRALLREGVLVLRD